MDIVPELSKTIKDKFNELYFASGIIKGIRAKLENGTATYQDAYKYSFEVGNIRAKVLKNNINSSMLPDGMMYFNIADRIVRESLMDDYELIANVSEIAQSIYNADNGIGLAAIKPSFNEENAMGIINRITSEPYDDIAWILDDPLKIFDSGVVDETIQVNSQFQYDSGIDTSVVRIPAFRCCEWCSSLGGTYTYPDVPRDVFKRHDNCKCTVSYKGGTLIEYKSKSGKANTFRAETKELTEEQKRDLSDKEQRNLKREFFVQNMKEQGWSEKAAAIYFNKNKLWLE